MYSRKSVGARMESWVTAALTRHSCKDSYPEPFEAVYYWKKKLNKAKYLTWNSIRLTFMKITSMLNHVKSREYIKCYSSGSPRPMKSPSNSIRYNCQKICSWFGRPKTMLETRKKVTLYWMINNSIIYKFFKDFTNHRKKTNRAVVFNCWPFPNSLK